MRWLIWYLCTIFTKETIFATSNSILKRGLLRDVNSFLIKKTRLYNFDPLKSHFYIYSKTGIIRGMHYFSYIAKNIDYGYSLEPPHRGGSNEYPQSMF